MTAVIVGGSVAGLAAALALSDAGWRATVLERAPAPPEGPVERVAPLWRRRAVPQATQAHTLTSVGVRVLRERAPSVLRELLRCGASVYDLTNAAPASCVDGDLVALACRRSVLELVLYRHVRARPGVEIRHGTRATGLLFTGPRAAFAGPRAAFAGPRAAFAGPRAAFAGPRVTGVSTSDGDSVVADIVVDASGRRAESRRWLGRTPDQTAASGISGYTRFYRLKPGAEPGPLNRGHAAGAVWDHYSAVLNPGDNGTFTVAFGTLPGDAAMARLRLPEPFAAAAGVIPFVGEWLERAEPISDVYSMTCPANAIGPFGAVPGLFPIGDAACVTNSLFGRGMSLALTHAFRLADLLADGYTDQEIAKVFEDALLPWYTHSAEADRGRIARWRTADDRPPDPVALAAQADPVIWRGLTRMLMGLNTPREVFDEAFLARARHFAVGLTAPRAPTRAQLLEVMGGAR